MNKSDIKRVIDPIKPDEGMEYRMAQKMKKMTNHRGFALKPAAVIAAGLMLTVLAGTTAIQYRGNNPGVNIENVARNQGVDIPAIQLLEGDAMAKMIGLIVYQGKIYTQTNAYISPEAAPSLLGEKLGTTKAGITEWSKQEDYAVEFASTVGIQEVFTVKGYDKGFRIMTYDEIDGVVYAQIFENLNGFTVKTGKDLFGKFQIEGNVARVQYESYESWNNGKENITDLGNLEGFYDFLQALSASIPREQDALDHLWEVPGETSQKFAYITLQDGTKVDLRLFEEGYVYYNNIPVFFEINDTAFEGFWNELQ